jgi:photosystem II stability/assembly factor-like uncharacterized protein
MTSERAWSVSDSPRVARLNGVESHGERAYCAGDHGVLLERTGRSQWAAVFTTGPDGDGRNLYDLSLTDDGRRVWFCGVAGTLGVYDCPTDTVETHHEPYDSTATYRSISANGPAGEETVHAADDNGEILRGTVDDGQFRVRGVSIPGDGTAFTEVVDNDRELFAADVAGAFYHTTDGRHWKRRRLADTPVRAISFDGDNVLEVADDGTVYEEVRLFGEGSRRPRSIQSGIASPTELDADGRTIVVVGGGGQLAVSEAGSPFEREDTGTTRGFYGADVSENGTVLAVGTGGTIAEGVPQ